MRINVPAELSPKDNKRFRELWLKHFDEEITVEKANREAHRLLSFYAVIIEHKENKRIKKEKGILEDR